MSAHLLRGGSAPLESSLRSWLKAMTYRTCGSLVTAACALALTGRMEFALGVGLLDGVAKLVLYYAHERVWALVPIGRGVAGPSAGDAESAQLRG